MSPVVLMRNPSRVIFQICLMRQGRVRPGPCKLLNVETRRRRFTALAAAIAAVPTASLPTSPLSSQCRRPAWPPPRSRVVFEADWPLRACIGGAAELNHLARIASFPGWQRSYNHDGSSEYSASEEIGFPLRGVKVEMLQLHPCYIHLL
jgi:hypothetical protein